jgi:hypothetical protein
MASIILPTLLGMLSVRGGASCPSAAAVTARLRELQAVTLTGAHGVQLQEDADGVRISLEGADGVQLGERYLSRGGSCETMAGAVAVIVSAWEGELAPGEVPAPSGLELGQDAAATISGGVGYELGASAFGSYSDGFAPGVLVVGSIGPRQGRLAAWLTLGGVDGRELALGSGTARWQRLWLSAGARLRLLDSSVVLEAHAEAVGALLLLHGTGFPTVFSEVDFDPGASAGLRLGASLRDWMPWLGLTGIGWLRSQSVRVAGLAQSANLPRYEVFLAAGLSYESF